MQSPNDYHIKREGETIALLVAFSLSLSLSLFIINMATNITWHPGHVSLQERQELLKQKVIK